jgi:hypothetical protein
MSNDDYVSSLFSMSGESIMDSWQGSGSDDDSEKTSFSGNTSPIPPSEQSTQRRPLHEQILEKASNGISDYKIFLGKYRFALRLIEDSLSRLVLYAPSRFVSHEDIDDGSSVHSKKIQPESLYALIHLWTLLNDSLYYGLGDGQGLTVGSDNQSYQNGDPEGSSKYTHILRSVLTILECLAPAVEVSAYARVPTQNSSSREFNVLKVMSHLERIKFICRLSLLGLHYMQYISNCSNDIVTLSGAGILQEGGILEPGEKVTKESTERRRISKMLYVGKRTGRRTVRTSKSDYENRSCLQDKTLALWRLLEMPQVKMLLLAAGEVLHIYRPLYWTTSCRDGAKLGEADGSRKYRGIISLVKSLAMDILSHILSESGSRVISSNGNTTINISSDATKMELQRRKMRWFLYLLRSPIWDVFTNPVSQFGGKILGCVPFVGKLLARYVIDLLLYWKKWHFMLESS